MTTLALAGQISTWWNELALPEQIFFGFGIAAGLIAVILAILAMIGMEHHDAIDAIGAHDGDISGGGGIFSIKPLTGFFLGFGWAGGIALRSGLGLPMAIVIALVCGGVIMGIIVLMFRAILGMRSDGTMQIAEAVGATGTVYITIPPQKADGGQVVVSFSGRQETFLALTAATRALASGERVRVVSIVDARTVLVESL